MSEFTRPGWDEYFLGVAEAISVRGDCRRSKVGAVIVDKNRIVVSTGFNGVAPGEKGCLDGACPRGLQSYSEVPAGGDYSNCIGTHAEDNAVRFARLAGQDKRLIGATAYITRPPCLACQALLSSVGVDKMVYPGGWVYSGRFET